MLRFLPLCGLLVLACGCANGSSGEVDPFGDAGPDATGPGTIGGDGAAGSVDGTIPSATCVHNSDCAAGVSNLCAGNNGVACLGGFCVPTGKPEDCDDGISCTDDSCDANTGACVHTPNDTECQAGAYCDPTENCVASLPCTPGDAICDRLDTSPCAGLWSCSATLQVCVQASAPCASIPNAVTLCDGAADAGSVPAADGGSVVCSWQCDPGYNHLVWTGSTWEQETTISSPPDSAGCDCKIATVDGSVPVDLPDYPGLVDSNCDGIDGTIAHAVFVSPTGSNSAAGTIAHPLQTLAAAIALAQSSGKDVYADKGTYNESVSLVGGVGLYGGYDSSRGWSRSTGNVSLIQGTSDTGVIANGVAAATTMQLFTISSVAGGAGTGASSYGVRVIQSAGPLLLQGCTVTPGAGGSGIPAAAAITGAGGGNASGGSGGSSSCSVGGGNGGAAVSGATGGISGGPGGGSNGGGGGGGGGAGAACCLPGNGGNGGSGNPGGAGSNGPDSTYTPMTIGTAQSDATYALTNGGPGSTGSAGGGGGGGGSGGAASSGCPFSCGDNTSGYGGGGGAGGCGGGGGGAGGGGGGSFGIVTVGSTVTVDQCQITAAKGGDASAGGGGAGGGSPGGGTGGGGGGTDSGSGGPGANGGAGGAGGAGSGATGGPSICVFYSGSLPTYSGSHCTRAGGGAAGASGGGAAPGGFPGIDDEIRGS